jgi:hypothetical protein
MNDGATHKGDEGPIYFSYAGPTAIVISHYRTKAIPFSEMTKANLIVPARTSHAASFPCNFLGKKRKENKRSSSAFLRAGGAESISGVRSPSALCALRRTVYAGPVSGFCVATALGMAEAGRPGPRPRRSSRLPAGWRWTPCRVLHLSRYRRRPGRLHPDGMMAPNLFVEVYWRVHTEER